MMSLNLPLFVLHSARNPLVPCRICCDRYAQISTRFRSISQSMCVNKTGLSLSCNNNINRVQGKNPALLPVTPRHKGEIQTRQLYCRFISSSAQTFSSGCCPFEYKCNANRSAFSSTSVKLLAIPAMVSGAKVRDLSTSTVALAPDKKSRDIENQENDDLDVEEIREHDKDFLKDDPELKGIIEDIKRDFGNTHKREHTDKPADTPEVSNLDPSKLVSTSKLDLDADLQLAEKIDTDFEYDYSVAEDIEEYDYKEENELAKQQVRPEKVLPISLERGQHGVFDIEEMLTLLEDLGAENIVSIPVPPSANFCDHMVVVSAKSKRHLQAMNEELLWIHKRKKSPKDSHLVIEGLDKSYWSAMDIGNIVLHIFHGDAREYYDIESLWTLGSENDPKCQEQGGDPYALSSEDLFWLETADTADSRTHKSGPVGDGDDSVNATASQDDVPGEVLTGTSKSDSDGKTKTAWSGRMREVDAGWGNSKPGK